ncbi:hypothetical protein ABZ383_30475 [Streptomyces sp. NPDC005900]|uniref:hypothetical protein n=1 Tax=Streptomyces sp. NPDC005900 TaxID=3154569 RepID=UPI0033D41F8A
MPKFKFTAETRSAIGARNYVPGEVTADTEREAVRKVDAEVARHGLECQTVFINDTAHIPALNRLARNKKTT